MIQDKRGKPKYRTRDRCPVLLALIMGLAPPLAMQYYLQRLIHRQLNAHPLRNGSDTRSTVVSLYRANFTGI